MSTMGKEKYRDEDDRQPPMCGGIVFNKFRPKALQDKKKRFPNPEDNLFKAFDQRPVMTDSRSATSSSASSDENPANAETALLHADKSRSKRGSGNLIPFKDFVHANTVDLSSLQKQEVLRSEFFMEEKSGKETTTGMPESQAVEFDPNDVHQLRGKHIGTKPEGRKSVQPQRELFIDSSFPYSPKPPKSPKSSSKEFASPVLLAPNDPMTQNPPQSSPFLESPTWNANIANQQHEAYEMISSQNIYYRNKLGDAQQDYHKLVKDQTDQADVIDKLKLEKESFQAETLLLREEMKAIRQQLEMFQKLLTQQVPETMTSAQPQPEPQEMKGSPPMAAVTKDAVVIPVGLEEFPSDFPFANPTNTVEDSEGKSVVTDPAKNYWKREWELSMEEIQQIDHNTTGNDTADLDDENSDPFCGISRLSPVSAPVEPVAPVTPVRGVDPPEVKRSSDHLRKSTPKKVSKELVTKKAEPSRHEFANKTFTGDKDYEDDIRYVQELMEKYHHQFILQEPSLSQDELRTSVKALDEQEKVFEIENMSDVDREYSQRQEEMARLRAAFERGELDESIPDSPIDFDEYPPQGSRQEEKKPSVNTHMVSVQPAKRGIVIHPVPEHKHLDVGDITSGEDFPAYPMPVFLRSMRLQEPTLPDPSEHRSTTRESRQDESYRSERSGIECQRDVSQHSTDTEYADQIEHSTSHHNALLWSQSRGNENTPTEEREPPPQKATSESSQLEKNTKSGRHVSLLDVMEGEEESSEQTLAEVRDPGRNGRKGATYKIKMCSGSSLRRYKESSSSSNDEATIRTNQVSRGKAIPVQGRKSLSRRLI